MDQTKNDPINPNHYKGLFKTKDMQCIYLSRTLDFDLGCWAKYIYRCGHKDSARQDFDKAKWYMEDWFATHMPKDPVLIMHKGITTENCMELDRDNMPIFNPFAEKARIAFQFLEEPDRSENTELFDRYRLLELVTLDFIVPAVWRLYMSNYEFKYLGDPE